MAPRHTRISRLDDGQLRLQPGPTGADLGRARRLVDASLAPLHELEVLDDVGDVEPLADQADLGQRAIEDLAGRPDEGRALTIFLVARLLPHQDDARIGWPAPKDGLARVAVEVASLAPWRGLAQFDRGWPRPERS